MKLTVISIALVFCVSACNSQQSAYQKAVAEKNAIETLRPGTVPAKAGSWTMTAKLNGKDWSASSMMRPAIASRIVGYYNNEYIGLPYDRRDMVVGNKIKFSENNAVDLGTNDDIGMWGGRKGQMEITKVEANWAEGKFYFTGSTSSSSKTVEVTDGFFRISLEK